MADSESRPSTSPELLQITTPLPPFDNPHADLILRSADGVNYRVMKAIMAEASPVFRDMLSLPQPGVTSEDHRIATVIDGTPVVQLTEKADTLDAVLRGCYPTSSPEMKDLTLIDNFLGAVIKYDMAFLIRDARKALWTPEIQRRGEAMKVYVIACRYQLEEEARNAAKDTLRSPYLLPYVPELENTTVLAYYRLLDYHRRATAAILSLFTKSSFDVIPSSLYPLICHLPICTMSGRSPAIEEIGGAHSFVAAWWTHFRERAQERVREVPLDEDIFTWPFLFPSFEVANSCETCRPKVYDTWAQLSVIYKRERDSVISSLPFDLPWA